MDRGLFLVISDPSVAVVVDAQIAPFLTAARAVAVLLLLVQVLPHGVLAPVAVGVVLRVHRLELRLVVQLVLEARGRAVHVRFTGLVVVATHCPSPFLSWRANSCFSIRRCSRRANARTLEHIRRPHLHSALVFLLLRWALPIIRTI